MHRYLPLVAVLFSLLSTVPQLRSEELAAALAERVVLQEQIDADHRDFVLQRIAPLEMQPSAEAWQREAAKIRQRVREEVVFRGIPESWRQHRLEVHQTGTIQTEDGYRIHKLRFEALPGLWIPALLYEPNRLEGKVVAVLNVNGHAATGKSTEYKQLRCINLAKRGMLALNLEWIGMGQLRTLGFSHNHLAKLDLCGVSGLSVFYLSMSRGIDVLLNHRHCDPERVAVTGLSGGGWQTIMLSSLDTRVKLAVPVAGHSALAQRVAHRNSIGDLEQNPTDLASIADYVTLNALMVPRPLHLIYNAQDNCCFVASTVKANTYQPVIPFYRQAGVDERLSYYENHDPGTHNYDRDNRQQLYAFLKKHLAPAAAWDAVEIPSDGEVLPHEALNVELPDNNADFHRLAAEIAGDLPRPPGGTVQDQRQLLQSVLRYEADAVEEVDEVSSTTVASLRVDRLAARTSLGWTLPIRRVRPVKDEPARTVVYLADSSADISQRVSELAASGCQVAVVDPVLLGQATPTGNLYQNAMLMATVGSRPLGVQVAQVLAAIDHLASPQQQVELHADGLRASLVARCAAALDGGQRIRAVATTGEAPRLKSFAEPSADYTRTPEAYCFGLLQHFELADLRRLAERD